MHKNYLKHLHPDDLRYWLAVETATWRMARATKAPLRGVQPIKRADINNAAGYFFFHPASTIQVSLREKWDAKAGWGARRPVWYVIDTIAHELAHCIIGREGGVEHGPRWQRTHGEMLVLADTMKIRIDFAAASV